MSYENYGCVSLNGGKGLPVDWSRARTIKGTHPPFVNSIIGHENGVADLYLTKDGKKKHQFAWCHPGDETKIDLLREQGYQLVTNAKDTWTKNPKLWTWSPEGTCRRMGEDAWARPAEMYFEEQAERERNPRDLTSEANSELSRKASDRGVIVRDSDGNALRPTQRAAAC